MAETVNDNCIHEDCVYRAKLTDPGKTFFCAYAMRTGHSRGCPISQCDKYRQGTKKLIMWDENIYVTIQEDGEADGGADGVALSRPDSDIQEI